MSLLLLAVWGGHVAPLREGLGAVHEAMTALEERFAMASEMAMMLIRLRKKKAKAQSSVSEKMILEAAEI